MTHLVHIYKHGFAVARTIQFWIRVAAHAVRVRHSHVVKDVSDLVRLMAVRAGGQDVGLFLPEFSTNYFAVDGFNLRVAFGAGGSDVFAIDRGGRVGVGQYRMHRVASGAGRSNGQPFFQQSLAVDALRVVPENVVLSDLSSARNRGTLAMALAANKRHFQGRDRGARVFHGEDGMVAMASHAMRS